MALGIVSSSNFYQRLLQQSTEVFRGRAKRVLRESVHQRERPLQSGAVLEGVQASAARNQLRALIMGHQGWLGPELGTCDPTPAPFMRCKCDPEAILSSQARERGDAPS
ncbi:hypothetical protein NDU88_000127, partial [Pleurodeles waltl]